MTEEELKNKCKERAKIFQQAMESCKSSSPMDCIEWFADRIAELEKENAELKKINADGLSELNHINGDLIIENEKLKKENVELKERIQTLEQIKKEHTNYTIKVEEERTSVKEQLTKAKEIIGELLSSCFGYNSKTVSYEVKAKAERFLKEE